MTAHESHLKERFTWASAMKQLLRSRLNPVNTQKQKQATEVIFTSLQTLFETLAANFNSAIAHEPLMVTVRRPATSEDERDGFQRLIIATSFWALSIRGGNGTVEFFTLPATELPTLRSAELPSRAKLRFTIVRRITSRDG
jgi:hypothetical protein